MVIGEPVELIEISPVEEHDRTECDDRQEHGAGDVMIPTMTGYSAKSIDELPTLWGGFAKLVRAGLDITAFGANIMDLPPNYSTKSHDEAESGQQELYVALRGSGSVDIDDAQLPLDAGHMARVDAGTARVLSSGADGLRVLCIGGVPGGVYEPPEWSSTGE
jgi:mannose-6-phosphate isomerase-like protein (cupin superfamily)